MWVFFPSGVMSWIKHSEIQISIFNVNYSINMIKSVTDGAVLAETKYYKPLKRHSCVSLKYIVY